MDYSPGILDPHGFTASLTSHGIKYYDITGHDMGSIGPITGFPQSGYCVRYVHCSPLQSIGGIKQHGLNLGHQAQSVLFDMTVVISPHDILGP